MTRNILISLPASSSQSPLWLSYTFQPVLTDNSTYKFRAAIRKGSQRLEHRHVLPIRQYKCANAREDLEFNDFHVQSHQGEHCSPQFSPRWKNSSVSALAIFINVKLSPLSEVTFHSWTPFRSVCYSFGVDRPLQN